MKRYIALLMLLLLCMTVLTSHAQSSVVYAAIVDDNVFIYGLSDQPAQVTFNEPTPYLTSPSVSHLTWSADGSLLAFVQRTITTDGAVFIISYDVVVVNFNTSVIYPLDVQATSLFPISFFPDGRLMFTQEAGYVEGSSSLQIINVFVIVPDGESLPEQIGTFAFGRGCGGGSSFLNDTLYWGEAGGLNGNGLFLANTSAGIIHTPICTGQGIALLSPDGNSIMLNNAITRPQLSPDGNRLVGIANEDILIYDLMTQTEQRIDIQSVPSQVAWGPQGSNDVYYSVITEGPRIRLEGDRLTAFSAFIGSELPEIPTFGLNIRRYNLTSTDDTTIYGGFGSAIGRMKVTADGTQLIFSVVPNPNAWVEAAVAGQLGTSDTRNYSNEIALLPIEVVALDLASGTSSVIGTGQQFSLR